MDRSQKPPAAASSGRTITICALGREWLLQRYATLEELWDAMGESDFGDERIPYWTELWPGSLVLARWLGDVRARIVGRLCLELGCGLGFTAIVGAWLGARLLACDYEAASLKQARHNASINGVAQPQWLLADWRMPALAPGMVAHIWAADIVYEKRSVLPILQFVDRALAPGGCFWIAEQGRPVFRDFLELAAAGGWIMEKVRNREPVRLAPQHVTVSVWEGRRQ